MSGAEVRWYRGGRRMDTARERYGGPNVTRSRKRWVKRRSRDWRM